MAPPADNEHGLPRGTAINAARPQDRSSMYQKWGKALESLSTLWDALEMPQEKREAFAVEKMCSFSSQSLSAIEAEVARLQLLHRRLKQYRNALQDRYEALDRLRRLCARAHREGSSSSLLVHQELLLIIRLLRHRTLCSLEAWADLKETVEQPLLALFLPPGPDPIDVFSKDIASVLEGSNLRLKVGFGLENNPLLHPACPPVDHVAIPVHFGEQVRMEGLCNKLGLCYPYITPQPCAPPPLNNPADSPMVVVMKAPSTGNAWPSPCALPASKPPAGRKKLVPIDLILAITHAAVAAALLAAATGHAHGIDSCTAQSEVRRLRCSSSKTLDVACRASSRLRRLRGGTSRGMSALVAAMQQCNSAAARAIAVAAKNIPSPQLSRRKTDHSTDSVNILSVHTPELGMLEESITMLTPKILGQSPTVPQFRDDVLPPIQQQTQSDWPIDHTQHSTVQLRCESAGSDADSKSKRVESTGSTDSKSRRRIRLPAHRESRRGLQQLLQCCNALEPGGRVTAALDAVLSLSMKRAERL